MVNENDLKSRFRWFLLASVFIIMMVISIYQYSWFLFAYAIQQQYAWDLAAVGLTFTVFAYAATFVQPFSGYIADSYGPRKMAIVASVIVGLGFILCSYAADPVKLYLFYGFGGLGVGVLYGISTSCAIKWFPDKRGFATGLAVFGFGAGTALFNFVIQGLLDDVGLSLTFKYLGIVMIIVLVPLSFLLKYPASPLTSKEEKKNVASSDFSPVRMIKTRQWFLIYFSFMFTVSIVLMFGAQMKMLAKEFQIPAEYFAVILVIFPLGNGLSRVVAGYISDKIGREKTMTIFYSLLGISIFCFVLFAGNNPILFVVIVFIAALLGGAPFALYPATIGDYYGTTYSTTNYGITYTAKAWAGLMSGWASGYLVLQFGSFKIPLIILAVCCLIAAIISHPKVLTPPSTAL
jgi:OFA family oxalate/formate antiporter-like MFS transporter